MTATRTDSVDYYAERLRKANTRHPNFAGIAEVTAVGCISAITEDDHLSVDERLAEIRDVLAAVRNVRAERVAAAQAALDAAHRESTR